MNVTPGYNILDELMVGLNFAQPVESFILLTPAEKARLDAIPPSTWVTREKLLTIYTMADVPKEYHENFELLFQKAQAFEKAYGHRLIWTSVFRSWAHHLRVYAGINEARRKAGLPPLPVPSLSKHLRMLAADCKPADKPISHLHDFVRDEAVLRELMMWAEALKFTPAWFHWQPVQYGSWTPGKSHFFNI